MRVHLENIISDDTMFSRKYVCIVPNGTVTNALFSNVHLRKLGNFVSNLQLDTVWVIMFVVKLRFAIQSCIPWTRQDLLVIRKGFQECVCVPSMILYSTSLETLRFMSLGSNPRSAVMVWHQEFTGVHFENSFFFGSQLAIIVIYVLDAKSATRKTSGLSPQGWGVMYRHCH